MQSGFRPPSFKVVITLSHTYFIWGGGEVGENSVLITTKIILALAKFAVYFRAYLNNNTPMSFSMSVHPSTHVQKKTAK